MKLFGNDSSRPHVSRNTASFEPISEEKADKARAAARKKADKARSKAYKQYTESERRSYSAAKNSARGAKSAAGTEKPAKRSSSGRGKKAAIIVACVLAVLVLGTTGFAFYVSGTDTIYPNVTLGGVNVGGMTLAEAANELTASGWTKDDESVSVELPMDHTLTVSASEAGASVTAEQAAQTAYDYCHEGNLFTCLWRYLRCMVSGGSAEVKIDVDEDAVGQIVDNAVKDIMNDLETSGVELDEEKGVLKAVKGAESVGIDSSELSGLICNALAERRYGQLEYTAAESEGEELDVDELYENFHREAADAYYDKEKGEIVPSVTGVDFDKDEAQRLWKAAKPGETVEIPCEITEPEYTTEKYEEMLFADTLGTSTTSLSGSTANRINNVELASNSINGVVLMPGEQFDYNKTLGQRTTERGYKPAGAYSGGQVVQEVGGGICQVSSTLYYSALLSNLKIDTRTFHYFPVGYLPPGLDATVSWGGPEFRFTNNRDWPIKIVASVDKSANTVTVTILGTNVDGSYVKMEYSTSYVYGNSEYPETATGYRAQTYRCVYDASGNLLSRTKEASSEYHYHEENIVYPTPSPTPTPTPTPGQPVIDPGTEPVVPDTPVTPETPAAQSDTGTPGVIA